MGLHLRVNQSPGPMNLLITSNPLKPIYQKLSFLLRLLAGIILFQSLFYKFGGHPDSIALFSMLGIEPYGRVGLGIIELGVVILLFIPKTQLIGSALGVGIMSGAIFTHVFQIGIEFNEDGGRLFSLALLCFACCFFHLLLFYKFIYTSLNKKS